MKIGTMRFMTVMICGALMLSTLVVSVGEAQTFREACAADAARLRCTWPSKSQTVHERSSSRALGSLPESVLGESSGAGHCRWSTRFYTRRRRCICDAFSACRICDDGWRPIHTASYLNGMYMEGFGLISSPEAVRASQK